MINYEAEAKEKWGHTQAYQEYEAKHAAGQQPDPAAGLDERMAAFAACMKAGESPDSAQAQSLVSALQDHITQHFYRCTKPILAGLGQMYVADPRFQQNIDKHAPGTAAFIRDAILIYCRQ